MMRKPGCPKRVLVVDDDPQVREFLAIWLEALGFEVASAANGLEALAQAQDIGWEFDAVVSDVNMPRMSGTELARAMLSHGAGIPIILLSGAGSEPEIEDVCRQANVQFLPKPITLRVLQNRLDLLLKMSEKGMEEAENS